MTHNDLVVTSLLLRTIGPPTWLTQHGKLVERRYGGASGRAADLPQVRPNPQRLYGRPDTGHGSCADSQPLLEDDDRPRVPFTRIKPRVVHGHGKGFPRPHQPGPSTGGNGPGHNLIPTPARALGGSPIGSPGGTPANGVTDGPDRGIPPDIVAPQPRVAEARPASPTPTPARSQSRSYNPAPTELDLDTLSIDTTNSLREQVRRVHQRLDKVQKKVLKSRGEVGESPKRGSPFTPKIQSKPLLATFRIPALEPYDGSDDSMEHIATFRAQMVLYDTSEALMCQAFPTTLRGSARTWYYRLKPTFIPSFDSLAKEFELNFLASARPRPTTTSLLGMAQESDEPLSQFVGRFTSQVQGIPDLHPSLSIQAFLTGLRSSRFFWSLIERPPMTLPEMLQRAHQYMAVETLIAGKWDETKRSRGEQSRGHSTPPPKRREDREYGHDTEECRNLQYQIKDLIRRGHLQRYVREQPSLPDGRPSQDSSPRPQGPVEKQIDVIFGGPASGGNSSSARKAYARSEARKRSLHHEDLDITFRSGGEEHSSHDDALVISIRMANAYVKRVMIDTGSSTDIMYFDAFQRMGLTNRDLTPL
ncbi:hypothetical protein B296_00005968, partial [Ensete ventricosum]